jgi:multidrug efflux pump subunit AcrA (membrane-fusion protein)
VRVGGTQGSDVEIIAGVADGDRLVVGGPENLRDGQRVDVKQ